MRARVAVVRACDRESPGRSRGDVSPKIRRGARSGYSGAENDAICQGIAGIACRGIWYARERGYPQPRNMVLRVRGVSNIRAVEAIVTSPDFDNTGNAGYGAGANANARNSGVSGSTVTDGRTDDVSFAKSIGVDEPAGRVKGAAQDGMATLDDAMSQLQSKASELTAKLMDKVNVDELTQKLEEQVRDHPARTLLFAAGAGFMLGRAAKK
jgi:ElaB/YqjD/DUF883 family membrane-anchored ribosome-binding protein